MQQALSFPKPRYLIKEEEDSLRDLLDRLFLKKISIQSFLEKDLSVFLRIVSTHHLRTLLHWAVLNNHLDLIRVLAKDPILKFKRDAFGLSPVDIARLLNRKEAIQIFSTSKLYPFPDLPTLKNFEYLPFPIFETRQGFEEVLTYVAKAKRSDTISSEKIWMGIYFDKELQTASHPPISIRYIDDGVGYGVFADKTIPPCSFVGEYTGVIKERSPKLLKEKKHSLRYTVWEGKKNFTIDAEKGGNFTRFINHSSKPNLGLQSVYWRGLPRMIFIALREIREGAQLTFDYGPIFWKNISQSPKEFFDDL